MARLDLLATELLQMITDEVDIEDHFYLSISCKRLWDKCVPRGGRHNNTREKYPFARLRAFLKSLSRRRPDDWYCDVCVQLHLIDTTDVPGFSDDRYSPSLDFFSSFAPHGGPSEAFSCVGMRHTPLYLPVGHYAIRQCHVEVAVKSARLGTNSSYLASIMAPVTKQILPNGTRSPGPVDVTIVPRIVNGRFILYVRWTCNAATQKIAGRFQLMPMNMICPHMMWWPKANGFYPHKERPRLEATTLSRNIGSCPHCLTDYTVVRSTESFLEVEAWYDLGDGIEDRGWLPLPGTGGMYESGPWISHLYP